MNFNEFSENSWGGGGGGGKHTLLGSMQINPCIRSQPAQLLDLQYGLTTIKIQALNHTFKTSQMVQRQGFIQDFFLEGGKFCARSA